MGRRWRFKVPVLVAAAGILLFLTSCYKDYDLDTNDYDIVVTDYDPKADFQSKPDYALPAEIKVITDPLLGNLDPLLAGPILAEINAQMQALGYTPVADPENDPRDITILVVAAETDYYYYYSGCWPYYGYTYCWDYPYYGGYYDYAFSAGSLLIQMVDSTGGWPPTGEADSAIWIAGINGIKDSSSLSFATARITERIDQAFAQSPYLDRN